MSVDKINKRRAMPWPRYRLAWYGKTSYCWHEIPKLYTDCNAVLAAAEREMLAGKRVRIGVLYQSGAWAHYTPDEFRGLHGQTEK